LQSLFAQADRPLSPAPWAAGVLLGTAWQLRQPQLWPMAAYAAVLGLAVLALVARHGVRSGWGRALLALWAALLVAMGQAGWRAAAFAEQALSPPLEGRDIVVTGRIDRSAPRGTDAVRFHLAVERAELDGQPVRLPPLLSLSWYVRGVPPATLAPALPSVEEPDVTDEDAERQGLADQDRREPRSLQAGELWRMPVRLKAPHGQSNPHGFDQELRMWEQGVQALGYVRTAARHAAPVRLAPARGHWIERARQATGAAIAQQVASPSQAGVIAALVMGEQQAIERADWDVFRATGVAHLMSISGLHITLFAWLAGTLLTALWRASARWSPAWCLALPAHVAGAWGGGRIEQQRDARAPAKHEGLAGSRQRHRSHAGQDAQGRTHVLRRRQLLVGHAGWRQLRDAVGHQRRQHSGRSCLQRDAGRAWLPRPGAGQRRFQHAHGQRRHCILLADQRRRGRLRRLHDQYRADHQPLPDQLGHRQQPRVSSQERCGRSQYLGHDLLADRHLLGHLHAGLEQTATSSPPAPSSKGPA